MCRQEKILQVAWLSVEGNVRQRAEGKLLPVALDAEFLTIAIAIYSLSFADFNTNQRLPSKPLVCRNTCCTAVGFLEIG